MGFHHRDGSYVGGCQAQILGTITVLALIALSMWASDNGIDLMGIIWTVIKWIIIVGIVLFIIAAICANISEKRKEKKEQQKNSIEKKDSHLD